MHFLILRVSHSRNLRLSLAVGLLLVGGVHAHSQTTQVRLSVLSLSPAKVKIDISGVSSRSWSFPNTFGRIVGLAERVEGLQGRDNQGRDVPVRKVASGEFRSGELIERISYEVALKSPSIQGDTSHVSWMTNEYGLFMLGDLLPQSGDGLLREIDLTFELPPGWSIASSEPVEKGRYQVSRPDKAVFLSAPSLREQRKRVGTTELSVASGNEWAFEDRDPGKIVAKLIGEYGMMTRRPLPGKVSVLLIPFSGSAGPDQWSADTRGRNLVLVMGKEGSRSALLSRLRVVLAHELFHLWVPNALALEGDYDWFFEGFTLYQAMLTGLRLHYISFNDYLDTIARVYDSYRSSAERDKLSLIEASERRWTTSASLVYDKGMLVALLYDLKVRRNSGNRTTVTDVYSGLFREVTSNRQDANDLIISMLNRRQGMDQFGRDYIQTAGQINLAQELEPYGLDVETTGSITEVKVRRTISSDQRQLLKTLGYKR
jgi:hypothetical protein